MLSPEVRAELCDRLAVAGIPRVEAASFVNLKRVPQMADAEEVLPGIQRRAGTSYAGLCRTRRATSGLSRRGGDEGRYAFPVAETFAERNEDTNVADATRP